ncbi:MAG: TetR/AcrR family transcriptional regulator [Armatimonadota bacterium]|nr:TetR/AcrR family transcriptional regulator [Armatimonadota bacterium]
MVAPLRHPPAPRPQRRGAHPRRAHRVPVTREQVLRAAAALFRARGFERTTMQAIARAVGLTKASLYHHVRGKQALLYEILQHTLDRALPDLERIAATPAPAAERLRAAVRLHILTLVHDRDNVACFLEEGRALAPEYRQALMAWRDRYEALFRRIIADGIATGEFAPTDVRLAGFAVLGMVNWVVRWYRPDGQHTADEIAAHFAAYATGALQRGPRDAAPVAPPAGGDGP